LSIAPEVIQKQGYREEVDWWSMGVVLFEFLFGKRPFRGRSSREVASKIVKGPLQFPTSKDISDECYDFIAKLLRKKGNERIGYDGVDEIKTHPFFSGIDWNAVENKRLQPLFVPDVKFVSPMYIYKLF
jgi:serine/threonine kinase 32